MLKVTSMIKNIKIVNFLSMLGLFMCIYCERRKICRIICVWFHKLAKICERRNEQIGWIVFFAYKERNLTKERRKTPNIYFSYFAHSSFFLFLKHNQILKIKR